MRQQGTVRLRFRLLCAAALCAAALFWLSGGRAVKAASAEDMQAVNIVYDFEDGNYYAVSGAVAMTLLATNPDGSYFVDPASQEYVPDPQKILVFVQALDELYPRSGNSLEFNASADGRPIALQGGAGGVRRYMNYSYERDYLTVALEQGLQEVHVPLYGLGGTYVEVDLTHQHLYYYENSVQRYQAPVVTGNLRAGHGTPTGVFRIQSKALNQYLVGGSKEKGTYYRSFVNYWVNIYRNSIGIHDATWRSRFGGEIYKTHGSHGCINVPLADMQKLYPMLQTGTTVVVFY